MNPALAPKPHYALLDGLRGVAAMMVIWFHVGEAFATSPVDQFVNHGYLAVDFFFVLSGFVIGYAYDGRWRAGLTAREFVVRRLIRLQPMVIVALLFGVASYVAQGCVHWNGEKSTYLAVFASFVLALFFIPAVPGTAPEVRGGREMFPLNGPQWSLFFEYIGSLAYAFILRRLSTKALAAVVGMSAVCLSYVVVFGNKTGYYNLGIGWSLAENGFLWGFYRMAFSFAAGLLMSRVFKPVRVRGAFALCSALIVVLMALPYVNLGSGEASVLNGVYELVCTLVVFPAIVWLGASGTVSGAAESRVCKFLGDISYPLYIVHYPAMYYFYSWVWGNDYTFAEALPVAFCIFFGAIAAAWLLLRYYDAPVRAWLSRRFLDNSTKTKTPREADLLRPDGDRL